MWVAERHPPIFSTVLLGSLVSFENAESNASDEPCRTIEEINQSFREYIGLTKKSRRKGQTAQVELQAPWGWTGQDFPVGSLMQIAVQKPRAFCRLCVAAFLQPPRRRPTPRGSWPEAGAA